jgi:CheY-like chemotaxis protein
MSTKRILIIHDDRILTNLYREKLEGSGFTVDAVKSLESVPKIFETRKPDLVLLDLVLREGGALEFISSLRQDPTTVSLPVLVFPTALGQLAEEAKAAGATRVIARTRHPLAAILDTVKTTLGMPGLGGALDTPLYQPDEAWLDLAVSSAPETLNLMRHCLPGIVSEPPDFASLRTLWTLGHTFTDRASLLSAKALTRVAAAVDLLLCDINLMPEQLNSSTRRTIGQGIDFLAVLADPKNLQRAEEPANARILVVEDEESAREFIGAAMQLAGLRCETAATPGEALAKLEGKTCELIFLDVGLPEMNGFELCSKIRAMDAHKHTPIVFLTGMATFQNKAQASLSGGNDFTGKPFNLPELGLKALIWILRGQLGLI